MTLPKCLDLGKTDVVAKKLFYLLIDGNFPINYLINGGISELNGI